MKQLLTILLIFIVTMSVTSCYPAFDTGPGIVIEITYLNSGANTCFYSYKAKGSAVSKTFVDTCGKFNVGDYVSMQKDTVTRHNPKIVY